MLVISQSKFIVLTKEKILTLKGFVRNENAFKSQIRFFPTPNHARIFMEQKYNVKSNRFAIKKVNVKIEEVDELC